MKKKTLSSQWEFDDLFSNAPSMKSKEMEDKDSNPPEEKPLSVAQLTAQIRSALELEYGHIKVRGEVTNLRIQNSGHIYFSLKDAAAQIQCVLFRGQRNVDRELIQDGDDIIIHGGISIYEARGQYQIIVRGVEPAGQGALQAAFERLKRKLEAEGLFDPKSKKPMPRFMQNVGIVTSLNGAAIQDVVHVVERRFPGLNLLCAQSRVQGDGAAYEIAEAIRDLNQWHKTKGALDVILVTRGGGSLEDLWAFNEEVVARAIHESVVPVISAVGHEIDFTISDFTADLRAATPSAAAELITEEFVRTAETVRSLKQRLLSNAKNIIAKSKAQLKTQESILEKLHPRRKLQQWLLRVDDLQSQLIRSTKLLFSQKSERFHRIQDRFDKMTPQSHFDRLRNQVHETQIHLLKAAQRQIKEKRDLQTLSSEKLHILSPFATLDRGYAIAFKKESEQLDAPLQILRSSEDVESGEKVQIQLKNGNIETTVD